jgi:hypothetical protein
LKKSVFGDVLTVLLLAASIGHGAALRLQGMRHRSPEFGSRPRPLSASIPGKGWFTYFRVYGPKKPTFDGTWKPGDFEEVK